MSPKGLQLLAEGRCVGPGAARRHRAQADPAPAGAEEAGLASPSFWSCLGGFMGGILVVAVTNYYKLSEIHSLVVITRNLQSRGWKG